MKKLFLYQLENQRDPDYRQLTSVMPIQNVANSMKDSLQLLRKIEINNTLAKQVFSSDREYYNETLKNFINSNTGIDSTTLDQWIHDREFDELLLKNSHLEIDLSESIREILITDFLQTVNIHKEMLRSYRARLHVQMPGHVFPLHIDRARHHDNNKKLALNAKPSNLRFLIFVDDQQPGQMFQMDLAHLNWKQGDVYTWNPRDTMHASANAGYWPRRLLLIDLNKK